MSHLPKTAGRTVSNALRSAGMSAAKFGTARVSGKFTTDSGFELDVEPAEKTIQVGSGHRVSFKRIKVGVSRVRVSFEVSRRDDRNGLTWQQLKDQAAQALTEQGFEFKETGRSLMVTGLPEEN